MSERGLKVEPFTPCSIPFTHPRVSKSSRSVQKYAKPAQNSGFGAKNCKNCTIFFSWIFDFAMKIAYRNSDPPTSLINLKKNSNLCV